MKRRSSRRRAMVSVEAKDSQKTVILVTTTSSSAFIEAALQALPQSNFHVVLLAADETGKKALEIAERVIPIVTPETLPATYSYHVVDGPEVDREAQCRFRSRLNASKGVVINDPTNPLGKLYRPGLSQKGLADAFAQLDKHDGQRGSLAPREKMFV